MVVRHAPLQAKKRHRPKRFGLMPTSTLAGTPIAAAKAPKKLTLKDRLEKANKKKAFFDVDGFVAAIAILREILSESPSYGPAHAAIAECYAYWGFRREIVFLECESYYQAAQTHATAAIKLVPELSVSHRAMAIALRRGAGADDIARKEEALIALDLDPNDAENWYEYWRAFGYSSSDPAIQRALELDPALIGAYIDFGAVLCKEGRLQEAASQFRAALQINPDHSLAIYNLAMVLYRIGNPEDALAVLTPALAKNTRSVLMAEGLKAIVEGGSRA